MRPVIDATGCIMKRRGCGRIQSWLICSARLHSENATGGTEIKHENPDSGYPESPSRQQPGTSTLRPFP